MLSVLGRLWEGESGCVGRWVRLSHLNGLSVREGREGRLEEGGNERGDLRVWDLSSAIFEGL